MPVPPPAMGSVPLSLAEAIARSVGGSLPGTPAEAQVVLGLDHVAELDALAAELGQLEGVSDVRAVSQGEALAEVREILGADSPMVDRLTEGQIPARLDVQVVDDDALAGLRSAIGADVRVQEVLDDRLRPDQVSATLQLTVGEFAAEMDELAAEGPSDLRQSVAVFAAAAGQEDPLDEADISELVEASHVIDDFGAKVCGLG